VCGSTSRPEKLMVFLHIQIPTDEGIVGCLFGRTLQCHCRDLIKSTDLLLKRAASSHSSQSACPSIYENKDKHLLSRTLGS